MKLVLGISLQIPFLLIQVLKKEIMTIKEYKSKRDALIMSFNNFKIESDEKLVGQFNLVSASLHNFIPDVPFSAHLNIYKNILLHKKLSILEQQAFSLLDNLKIESDIPDVYQFLKSRPTVICTFHIGSYRLINLLLTKYGVPFSLVIGKDIGAIEGSNFSSLFRSFCGSTSFNGFSIIDAEDSRSGLKMLKELKQGRTLVLYIDGNSGAGAETTENENSCLIQFMQQQLHARKGISALSFIANVPIVTAVSYRVAWDDVRLRFFEPILPDKMMDRETFAIETTQRIYDMAVPIIRANPEQWEGWLYIHHVARIKSIRLSENISETEFDSEQLLLFNSDQFGIFKAGNIAFLLRKNGYFFYEIDSATYTKLIGCVERPARRGDFGDSLFKQLYINGVLSRTCS
jgi:hypothetical protein